MKHNFEEHRQNRIEHANRMVEKKERESDAQCKRADDIAKYIPPGQPILVGHYSEKRHRKDLERIHNATRASIEAEKKPPIMRKRQKPLQTTGLYFPMTRTRRKNWRTKLNSYRRDRIL